VKISRACPPRHGRVAEQPTTQATIRRVGMMTQMPGHISREALRLERQFEAGSAP
jgi:hypothetical protein